MAFGDLPERGKRSGTRSGEKCSEQVSLPLFLCTWLTPLDVLTAWPVLRPGASADPQFRPGSLVTHVGEACVRVYCSLEDLHPGFLRERLNGDPSAQDDVSHSSGRIRRRSGTGEVTGKKGIEGVSQLKANVGEGTVTENIVTL